MTGWLTPAEWSAVRLSVRTTENAGIAAGPPTAPMTITEPWIVSAWAPGKTSAASAGRNSADTSLRSICNAAWLSHGALRRNVYDSTPEPTNLAAK